MGIRIPTYRLHKARNLAVVTLAGQDHYLGKYGTPESWEKYHRLIAEWLANKENPPATLEQEEKATITVLELIHAYWKHAKTYYVKNGAPTSEQDTIRQALRYVRKLYGSTPTENFSPKALKAVREAMIQHKITQKYKVKNPETGEVQEKAKVLAHGLSRRHINKQINRIKRMFAWAVEEELVPVEVYAALKCVKGLRKGKTAAREKPRVPPVSDAHVQAVLPIVPAMLAIMIQVHRLCGCRPQELVEMSLIDIDRHDTVWAYRPRRYKTEHHNEDDSCDRERVIFLGPKAQELLKPYLSKHPQDYIFSPRRSEQHRNALRRQQRKTPMTPCQRRRKPKGRKKAPLRDHYDVASYRRAIRRGCQKAGIPVWHPNQLRHSSLTEIRRRFGLEASKACGGHREIGVTQHYAEQDRELARKVMEEIG